MHLRALTFTWGRNCPGEDKRFVMLGEAQTQQEVVAQFVSGAQASFRSGLRNEHTDRVGQGVSVRQDFNADIPEARLAYVVGHRRMSLKGKRASWQPDHPG